MNTPRTDAQVFVASGGQQVAPLEFTRQLETEVQELREALEDLTLRCDGDEGVRADGSNIQTYQARAVLEKYK